MQRVILLDTETTGLSPAEGHRILEIGCVEMVNLRITGKRRWYVNPERDIPAESFAIHGISEEMVADAPRFADIAAEFLAFIADDTLVIHNAEFDLRFLNAELSRCDQPLLGTDRVEDTIALSRKRFPGGSASLDALCRRFNIDNTHRTLHGALIDAELLAQVYVELKGGKQAHINFLQEEGHDSSTGAGCGEPGEAYSAVPARTWPIPEPELEAHRQFLEFLQRESGDRCIWQRIEATA
jgi:DNA polymerase-3 subunit epsilon